jgi:ribosomal protein S18 acetylase RimI-like enzyme
MSVRRATEADHDLVRELRMRSLADAPDAFGATLESELGRPPEMWLALVRGDGWGGRSSVFIAEDGGTPAGLTIGVRHHDEGPEFAHLYAMWVDPAFRRRGHGAALVEAVVGWARDEGATTVRLGATSTNPAAIELYRGLGFIPTGESDPLRAGSDLTCMAMERVL